MPNTNLDLHFDGTVVCNACNTEDDKNQKNMALV